jgi:hypothetical protein
MVQPSPVKGTWGDGDAIPNVVPSSPILVTLMIEALCSSETSDLTATRRDIPETTFFTVTAVKTSNLTWH